MQRDDDLDDGPVKLNSLQITADCNLSSNKEASCSDCADIVYSQEAGTPDSEQNIVPALKADRKIIESTKPVKVTKKKPTSALLLKSVDFEWYQGDSTC